MNTVWTTDHIIFAFPSDFFALLFEFKNRSELSKFDVAITTANARNLLTSPGNISTISRLNQAKFVLFWRFFFAFSFQNKIFGQQFLSGDRYVVFYTAICPICQFVGSARTLPWIPAVYMNPSCKPHDVSVLKCPKFLAMVHCVTIFRQQMTKLSWINFAFSHEHTFVSLCY